MSRINKIKVIFFDLDNTLWDFDKNSKIALGEIYDLYLKPLDKSNIGQNQFIEIITKNNDQLWEEYRKGIVTKEELRFLRFRDTLDSMGIYEYESIDEIDMQYLIRTSYQPNLIDNAVNILEYLYPKYSLGLITNGFFEAQQIKLTNCKIDRYFKYIVISEKAGVQKPDSAIFKYALELSSSKACDVYFVGDDFNVDIKGAYNAGISSIWLNSRNLKGEEGISYTEIKSLIELKDIF